MLLFCSWPCLRNPNATRAERRSGQRCWKDMFVLEMRRDVPSVTILSPPLQSQLRSPSLTLVSVSETKPELRPTLHCSTHVGSQNREAENSASHFSAIFTLKVWPSLSPPHPQGRYGKWGGWVGGRLYTLHNKYTEFTFRSNEMPDSPPRLKNTYTLLRKAKPPALTHPGVPGTGAHLQGPNSFGRVTVSLHISCKLGTT